MYNHRTQLGYYSFSPENLKALFGTGYKPPEYDRAKIEEILNKHKEAQIDVSPDKIDQSHWKDFPEDFQLPRHGKKNLRAYIRKVSKELTSDLLTKLEEFYLHPEGDGRFISAENIIFKPGWTRYPYDPAEPITTNHAPDEDCYVIDTETFVRQELSKYGLPRFSPPVIATASSNKANYIWLTPNLFPENKEDLLDPSKFDTSILVPLIDKKAVVLAYNTSFDYSKIENSYHHNSQLMWVDLMSLHRARHGFSSEQDTLYKSFINQRHKRMPKWCYKGAKGDLLSAYNFYCSAKYKKKAKAEDKKIRQFFVVMNNLQELIDNKDELLEYSQKDAVYTFRLAKILLPDYLNSLDLLFPLYTNCVVTHSKFFINKAKYEAFLADSEEKYHESMEKQSKIFDKIAETIFEDYMEGHLTLEEIEKDPFYSEWDWNSKGKRVKRERKYYNAYNCEGKLIETGLVLPQKMKTGDFLEQLQVDNPEINKIKLDHKEEYFEETPGYGIPRWYYPIIESGTLGITHKSVMSHQLLRLKYKGEFVIKTKDRGWVTLKDEKVRHKKDLTKNVGCMLSKDFISDFEKGIISSDGFQKELEEVYWISKYTGFWTTVRKRAFSEVYIHKNGICCTNLIPHQTTSLRNGNKLYSTIPDPSPDKLGSDFKTFLQPRIEKGKTAVGFDFSGQELNIFGLLGSSVAGLENSTPLTHAISVGDKKAKPPTDFHSLTARLAGVDRGTGKGLNFSLQYGGGKKRMTSIIMMGNPNIEKEDAERIALAALKNVKGFMNTRDKVNYAYTGGIGSDSFNTSMKIADTLITCFPLSGAEYPAPLQKINCGKDFILTRNNMVCQSTGRHLLDIVILLTFYWAKKLGLWFYPMLFIHDAVYFEINPDQEKEACALLQLAHIFCWALLRESLGVKEYGLSGAFIEGFEVGDFFRKSTYSNTVTPFNPEQLPDHRDYSLEELLPTMNDLSRKLDEGL